MFDHASQDDRSLNRAARPPFQMLRRRRGAPLLGLILVSLTGCATTLPAPGPEALTGYDLLLKREYEQLAGLERPSWLGRDTRQVFAAKAGRVERGECVRPEQPAAWPKAQLISITVHHASGAEEVLSATALRNELIAQTAKAASASSRLRATYPDLDAARAHALGRYDCIIAFGREQDGPRRAAVCAAEYDRAALYMERAIGGPSDPPPELPACKAAS